MFIAQELYRTDNRSYYYFFLMFRSVSLRVLLEFCFSLELPFALQLPLLFLCLLESFHSFFLSLYQKPFQQFSFTFILNHEQARATLVTPVVTQLFLRRSWESIRSFQFRSEIGQGFGLNQGIELTELRNLLFQLSLLVNSEISHIFRLQNVYPKTKHLHRCWPREWKHSIEEDQLFLSCRSVLALSALYPPIRSKNKRKHVYR